MNKNIPYNQIVAYLHGELNDEAKANLEKWLDASNENKTIFYEYKTIFEAAGNNNSPEFDCVCRFYSPNSTQWRSLF